MNSSSARIKIFRRPEKRVQTNSPKLNFSWPEKLSGQEQFLRFIQKIIYLCSPPPPPNRSIYVGFGTYPVGVRVSSDSVDEF